jgi:threonine/homoserine/homoserine lactone efflux protein
MPVNKGTDDQPRRSWGHFSAGILTSLGNPKAILFYGSLFAAALPADAAMGLRMTGALLILATSVAIHAGLASVLSIDRVRLGYLRLRRPIDRVFGVLFVVFGIRLLASAA